MTLWSNGAASGWHHAGLAVLASLALLAGSTPALAEPRADTVSRGQVPVAPAEQLATDAVLRAGMATIKKLVHDHHSLVTHRRLPPDAAISFAARVRNETDAIVAKSTLTGKAADEIAPILGKLLDGAEAVAGRKADISQLDGIFLMDEALARYGMNFDDPDWNGKR